MIKAYKWKIIRSDWKHINEDCLWEFLLSNWVVIPKRLAKTEDVIKSRIKNILWENPISDLLIVLYHYGLINLTNNSSNFFEKEKEIKILNIEEERGKLIEKITGSLWGEMVFKWTINDMYFDTQNLDIKRWTTNGNKKASLRIRHKVLKWEINWSHYCTIKRKDWKSEDSTVLRDCYEEEFELFDPIVFYRLLLIIGLVEYRMKVKQRVALSLWSIKFDFDKYEGIPDLLEIEAPEVNMIEYYIKEALLLGGKKRLNGWTNSLFELYKKYMTTFIHSQQVV